MRFMLLINVPYADGAYQHAGWTPEDWRAHADFLTRFNRELADAGELVEIQALVPPAAARIVRVGDGGAPVVSDGPFAEAKEFLAGYWMIDVESRERAWELAGRASAAPGPGGVPLNLPLEVREVMRVCAPAEV